MKLFPCFLLSLLSGNWARWASSFDTCEPLPTSTSNMSHTWQKATFYQLPSSFGNNSDLTRQWKPDNVVWSFHVLEALSLSFFTREAKAQMSKGPALTRNRKSNTSSLHLSVPNQRQQPTCPLANPSLFLNISLLLIMADGTLHCLDASLCQPISRPGSFTSSGLLDYPSL